jgi:6-phosphofructokinase 1
LARTSSADWRLRRRPLGTLEAMRVGILTGGGDCPGLNAVIRAVVRVGRERFGHEHVGLRRGWKGLLEQDAVTLDEAAVSGILHVGGTILGSSRTNPFKDPGGGERCVEAARELALDALVAIGGEDTLGVARRLYEEHGLATVGVPKTIDNDLSGTDYTFGFWTAVQIATEAIDRLHTTAASHDRVMVVEVMGRHVGWIALQAGVAGGADAIVIPERPMTAERVAEHVKARAARGKGFSIVVISEGVDLGDEGEEAGVDQFGHRQLAKVGVGERLGARLADLTGFDTRVTVLGHVQRGGTPTAFDRVLATGYGTRAAELIGEGAFGRMAALRGDAIVDVPLAEAVADLKRVPDHLYEAAEALFGAHGEAVPGT